MMKEDKKLIKKLVSNILCDDVCFSFLFIGSFSVLLNRLESTGQSELIPKEYIRRFRELRNLAGTVSELAIPYVALKYPHYYKRKS